MKKLFKYSFVGVLGLLLFTSCYRDKGDYSYKDLNEISIDLPDVVSVQQGMVLEVSPKFTFALEEDETNLSYEWVVSIPTSSDSVNVVLSTDRDFSEQIDYASGNSYPFSLKVTDNSTGVTYRKGMSLEVRTEYQPGYFVVEQYDDCSDLSFYNTQTGKVFYNVFSEVNPDITMKPTVMDLYSLDYSGYSSPDGKVAASNMTMVFGEDWGYVIDYRSFRVLSDMEQMFAMRPAVIRPQVLASYIERNYNFALINDGKIYRMHLEQGQTLFGEPMITTSGVETGCASFIGSGLSVRGQLVGVLFFDQVNHCFYSRYQGTNIELTNVAGVYRVQKETGVDDEVVYDTLFNAAKVNKDWEMLGMPVGGSGNMYYNIVFRDAENVYVIRYDMPNGGFSKGPLNIASEEDCPGMRNSPVFVSPYGRQQIYYANGNEIRLYDADANTSRVLYAFPAGENVVSIVLPTNNGLSLTAATNNGNKGSIYAFTLLNTGDLKDPEPILLATDFGKIKKIVYKK